MEDKDCICFLKGKCCHYQSPNPCHTNCMGIHNCDVYVTKADLDNKDLIALLEYIEQQKPSLFGRYITN
jgi:hypothetical protein